ncbi:hypothetical protein TL16_g02760 [Triparma laevis f. inornata]|uniref:Uncharacterized protein n=1 Tax=Triparma laevis f. inornata TaxID=1714386 RepID=A0A9W6ZQU8_9STRA|nr:hypothetical protein TL16_g02760 [Triparma laevis f. inornata]
MLTILDREIGCSNTPPPPTIDPTSLSFNITLPRIPSHSLNLLQTSLRSQHYTINLKSTPTAHKLIINPTPIFTHAQTYALLNNPKQIKPISSGFLREVLKSRYYKNLQNRMQNYRSDIPQIRLDIQQLIESELNHPGQFDLNIEGYNWYIKELLNCRKHRLASSYITRFYARNLEVQGEQSYEDTLSMLIDIGWVGYLKNTRDFFKNYSKDVERYKLTSLKSKVQEDPKTTFVRDGMKLKTAFFQREDNPVDMVFRERLGESGKDKAVKLGERVDLRGEKTPTNTYEILWRKNAPAPPILQANGYYRSMLRFHRGSAPADFLNHWERWKAPRDARMYCHGFRGVLAMKEDTPYWFLGTKKHFKDMTKRGRGLSQRENKKLRSQVEMADELFRESVVNGFDVNVKEILRAWCEELGGRKRSAKMLARMRIKDWGRFAVDNNKVTSEIAASVLNVLGDASHTTSTNQVEWFARKIKKLGGDSHAIAIAEGRDIDEVEVAVDLLLAEGVMWPPTWKEGALLKCLGLIQYELNNGNSADVERIGTSVKKLLADLELQEKFWELLGPENFDDEGRPTKAFLLGDEAKIRYADYRATDPEPNQEMTLDLENFYGIGHMMEDWKAELLKNCKTPEEEKQVKLSLVEWYRLNTPYAEYMSYGHITSRVTNLHMLPNLSFAGQSVPKSKSNKKQKQETKHYTSVVAQFESVDSVVEPSKELLDGNWVEITEVRSSDERSDELGM